MTEVWATSDLHFGHANILKFNPDTRKYSDVQDMTKKMIAEWNSKVSQADEVYVLGDFAFCNAKDAAVIANRLNGKKYLIAGNHDKKNLASKQFADCFEWVKDYHEMNYNGKFVIMMHYALRVWNKAHHGSYHLYGHSHGSLPGEGRSMDVGVDATGNVVSPLDDILAQLEQKSFVKHH